MSDGVHVCASHPWRAEYAHMLGVNGFKVTFSPVPEDKLSAEDAIAADLSGIEKAAILIVDFVYFDSATAGFCVGYAVARGKSVIGLSCRDQKLPPWAKEAAYVVSSMADLDHAMRSMSEHRGAAKSTGTAAVADKPCPRCGGSRWIKCEHCGPCGCVVCAETGRVRCPDCKKPRQPLPGGPTDRCAGCGAERSKHDAQPPHECAETECEGFRDYALHGEVIKLDLEGTAGR
jgi:hypothetical protein